MRNAATGGNKSCILEEGKEKFNMIRVCTIHYPLEYPSATGLFIWVLWPFLLPITILILLYVCALLAYSCKIYCLILRRLNKSKGGWDNAARTMISGLWYLHGIIWHGYEVRGLHNVPDSGPSLFIFYHGAVPTDMYYFYTHVYFHKNRILNAVADHFMFKLPGFPILMECLKATTGTKQTCNNLLKEGNILAISPGGVYESQFSHNYNLMWKNRIGFAKVAIDAKVPIIPIFTENVREAFRSISFAQRLFLKLYTMIKLPVAPVYGAFPVKMITHVGKPIPYDPELTPEELQVKVAGAINELISENQRIPGSILHAMIDRISSLKERHKLNKIILRKTR